MNLKSLATCFCLLLLQTIVMGQIIPTPQYCKPKKAKKSHCTISKQRTFAAIVNSTVSKEELLEKTKAFFLEEQLIDSAALEVISYDESLSEYKLPFMFRQGMHYGTARGVKMMKTPVKLYFDARLVFNKEGQIQINFENFSEESFAMIKSATELDNKTPITKYPALNDIYSTSMVANAGGMLKALIFLNGGMDELNKIKENRQAFRQKLNNDFSVYDKLVKQGKAKWISDEKLAECTVAGNKYFGSIVKRNIDDEKLISVDNERWDNYFEQNFIYFFNEITDRVNGKIEAIAIDGEILKKK